MPAEHPTSLPLVAADHADHGGEAGPRADEHRFMPLWVRLTIGMLLLEGFSLGLLAVSGGAFGSGPEAYAARIWVLKTALVLAAVNALVLIFTLRVTNRLHKITTGARRFAEGDLRHRIDSAPSREISALSDVLNDMAHQINGQLALLREQRNEQESILQSLQSGVLAIDSQQLVLSINRVAQQMLGVTQAHARGRPLSTITDHPAILRFAADASAEGSDVSREFGIDTSAGSRTIRATCGRLRDAEGAIAGTILLLSDITQIKRLEAMRADFAANASHELRTPITNIKGYVETLIESGIDDSELSNRFLGIVARNAERLGAIIDDMLALTSLDRAQQEEAIVRQSTPVGGIVQAVRTHLEPDARANNIRVIITISEPMYAMVNPRLAEQAVSNLVSNAIKYSPPGAAVDVRVQRDVLTSGRAAAKISVTDQGGGIESSHLPRIFERFYRVDKARSRDLGGTGLGLAIVKHIAMAHGGRVEVQSTVGQGSTFSLFLPLGESPEIEQPSTLGFLRGSSQEVSSPGKPRQSRAEPSVPPPSPLHGAGPEGSGEFAPSDLATQHAWDGSASNPTEFTSYGAKR